MYENAPLLTRHHQPPPYGEARLPPDPPQGLALDVDVCHDAQPEGEEGRQPLGGEGIDKT